MARHFRTPRLRNWTQLDSAVGTDSPAPNRSEALARRQSGRDYSQGRQTCLAKLNAAGFVRELMLERACAHVRLIGNRSTHRVANHDARAERVEARAATLRASYRGAGAGALTAPLAPGAPQAFSTIGALPALAAAPGTSAVRGCERGCRRPAHFDAPAERREPGPSGRASSRRRATSSPASQRAGNARIIC